MCSNLKLTKLLLSGLLNGSGGIVSKTSKYCILTCAIGRVWQMLPFYQSSYWLYECNVTHTELIVFLCKNLELFYCDWKKVFIGKKRAFMSTVKKKNDECKCILTARSAKLYLYYRALLLSWSGSLTLFLITVLSYQPVEFSRKTLPPLPHSLFWDHSHWGEKGSVFSLWYIYLLFLWLNIIGEKEHLMPSIRSFVIFDTIQ